MYAQIELSQQTSDGYRSSIYDSSFCANNHQKADMIRRKWSCEEVELLKKLHPINILLETKE